MQDRRREGLFGWFVAEEDVINRRVERALLNPEARRGVALRIEIDEKASLIGKGEAGSDVDGCRGLADAALLIHDRKDSSHPSLH